MADYTNATTGTLTFGGKDYAPGEKLSITDAQRKSDPTLDWWIRSEFVKPKVAEGEQPAVVQSLSYIPTFGGDTPGADAESTKPVITEPAKTTGAKP